MNEYIAESQSFSTNRAIIPHLRHGHKNNLDFTATNLNRSDKSRNISKLLKVWPNLSIWKWTGSYLKRMPSNRDTRSSQEVRTLQELTIYLRRKSERSKNILFLLSQHIAGIYWSMTESEIVKKKESKRANKWVFRESESEDASSHSSSQPSAGLYWTRPSLPTPPWSANAWHSWPRLPGPNSRGAGEQLLQDLVFKI